MTNKSAGLPEDGKDIKTGDQPALLVEESPLLLAQHQAYLTPPRRVRSVDQLEVGDVAEFVYNAEPRVVYVLNPSYNLQLHGISLKKIDHHAIVTEILDKARPNDTPREFYNRIVRQPSVQAYDAYRTYDVRKISNITVRQYVKTNV